MPLEHVYAILMQHKKLTMFETWKDSMKMRKTFDNYKVALKCHIHFVLIFLRVFLLHFCNFRVSLLKINFDPKNPANSNPGSIKYVERGCQWWKKNLIRFRHLSILNRVCEEKKKMPHAKRRMQLVLTLLINIWKSWQMSQWNIRTVPNISWVGLPQKWHSFVLFEWN
jgi:hypothetical protein